MRSQSASLVGYPSSGRPNTCSLSDLRSRCAVRRRDASSRRLAQSLVDSGGRENVLDDHDGRADHAGAVPELRRDDPQIARGKRKRPLEDDLAQAGEEVLVNVAKVAAEHDDARVEEVNAARQDIAERATGGAHRPDGVDVAIPHELDDIAAALGGVPRCGQLLRQRASAGDRLQAARVAASADDVFVAADDHVADVARGALRSSVDLAVYNDAASDPGSDLDVEEVLHLRPMSPVLAERHDVDVVVDEHTDVAVAPREPSRDPETVPARHDRGQPPCKTIAPSL